MYIAEAERFGQFTLGDREIAGIAARKSGFRSQKLRVLFLSDPERFCEPSGFQRKIGDVVPRYFFPTHDGEQLYLDDEGIEARDDSEARSQAIKSLCEMASDRFPRALSGQDLRLEVLNEERALVFEINLALKFPQP